MSNMYVVTTLGFQTDGRPRVATKHMYEGEMIEWIKQNTRDTLEDSDTIVIHELLIVGYHDGCGNYRKRLEMRRVYPQVRTTEHLVKRYQDEKR